MTTTETRTGIYEGMFLVNQSAAAAFGECLEHINTLFERAGATVVAMKKWDERRLSYEMDKQKRGVYILAYFTCATDMVAHLERDAVISDKIMRLLVTTADHLTDEEIRGVIAFLKWMSSIDTNGFPYGFKSIPQESK